MDYDAHPMQSPPDRPIHNEAFFVLLLLFAYGWLFVFFERINNPNELVRVYMARSIAFEHSYAIGERRVSDGRFFDSGPTYSSWGYVNDKALVCGDPRATAPACAGKLYAAKAPGASFLAAPIVLLLGHAATKTVTVFALRWLLCILPAIALWVALRRFLLERGLPEEVALAGALGSLSLTYGQLFAGHQMGAVALGAAFLCAFGRKPRPLALGFGAALAVCLEYPCAPAAALLGLGWLSTRPGRRQVALSLLGAVPPALALAHFQSSFGHVWSTPYGHLENPEFVKDIAPGFMGISLPTAGRLYGSLISPSLGLFYWAPWIAFAAWAAWIARRNRPALVASVVVAYYLVFQVTHALWRSGWTVGPRYITPIVPFAAIAIACALKERPRALPAFCAAAIAGIAATGLASSVSQGFPLEVQNPLREVVWPLLSHGWIPRNPLQLAGVPGLPSALPYFAALAAACAFLACRAGRFLVLAAALVALQWLAPASEERGAAGYFTTVWEPPLPPGARPLSE